MLTNNEKKKKHYGLWVLLVFIVVFLMKAASGIQLSALRTIAHSDHAEDIYTEDAFASANMTNRNESWYTDTEDPYLVLKKNLDQEVSVLEINLAEGQDRPWTLQLYYGQDNRSFTEEKSVRVPVAAHQKRIYVSTPETFQTFRMDFGNVPGLTFSIQSILTDPDSVSDYLYTAIFGDMTMQFSHVLLIVGIFVLVGSVFFLAWKKDKVSKFMERHPGLQRGITYFQEHPYLLYLCLTLLTLGIIFWPYWSGSHYYIFQDNSTGSYPLYMESFFHVLEEIRTTGLSIWNMPHEIVLDPFNLVLFSMAGHMTDTTLLYMFGWMQMLKILLLGTFGYLFLSQFQSVTSYGRVLASYMLSFSGYMMLCGQNPMLATVTLYIFLIFWLVEELCKKWSVLFFLPFVIAGCFLFRSDICCKILLVVVLYLFFRINLEGKKTTLKAKMMRWIKVGIAVLLGFLIGGLLQMVIVSPSLVVGDVSRDYTIQNWINNFLHVFSNNLSKSTLVYGDANPMFFSSLFPSFCILFFVEKIQNGKHPFLYTSAFLLFGISIVLLPAIEHSPLGFMNVNGEWLFMVLPFLVLVSGLVLSHFADYHYDAVVWGWLATIVFMVLCGGVGKIDYYSFVIVFFLLFGMVFITLKNRYGQEIWKVGLAVLLVANVGLDAYFTNVSRHTCRKDDSMEIPTEVEPINHQMACVEIQEGR